MNFLTEKRGIILAADVVSLEALIKLSQLAEKYEEVVAIKIGCLMALRQNMSVVLRLIRANTSVPVIYDHQKAGTDIPAMGKPFAEACRSLGVDAIIIFPLAGPKTLRAYVKGAQECDLEPIVGLVMTHESFLESEGGYIINCAPDDIRAQAMTDGVRCYVLPGTKLIRVSDLLKYFLDVDTLKIMMPGIGIQGGQLREAFTVVERHGHHPFAIIGSVIYKAENPEKALQGFIKEMEV